MTDNLVIAIIICAFLVGIFSGRTDSESQKRYKELERKHNALAEKTGNAELATTYISDENLSEVKKLLYAGKKVQAIQLVRKLTNMELLEAKLFVDNIEAKQ